jgi:hypothetical protein
MEHYLNTNPEALGEEGNVYRRMRQMLKEGWKPAGQQVTSSR